ncbi:MAG: hypothetical protein ACRD4U_12350 [Candidatus Acidiferrales bacterium]
MNDSTDNAKLLELSQPELLIPLKVTQAGRVYRLRHVLRPPRAADWFAYEAALKPEVEELPGPDGGDDVSYRLHVRTTDAALLLWERLALRVEGYLLPEGGDDSGWRAAIPLAHKEAAVRALTLVAPASAPATDGSNDGGFAVGAGEVTVELECVSSGVAYPGLAHVFRPPTVEAERAYRRLLAETLIVRGGRAPRTILPARLPALVRLYDELIIRAEGYAINLQPPASRLQLLEHMDAWHKRVAVQTLFGDLTPETPQPAAASEALPEEIR